VQRGSKNAGIAGRLGNAMGECNEWEKMLRGSKMVLNAILPPKGIG